MRVYEKKNQTPNNHNPRCILTLSLPLFTAEIEAGAARKRGWVTSQGRGRFVTGGGYRGLEPCSPRGCRRVLDFRGGGELML